MSTINIVFQEKGKQNVIVNVKKNITFTELIHTYYKKVCASKKDKMTKLVVIKGSEISPEDSRSLNELDLHDYSYIEIQSTEKAVTAPHEAPKKEEPPQEEQPQEEQPQEEQPQEEQPQEEQPQEDNWD